MYAGMPMIIVCIHIIRRGIAQISSINPLTNNILYAILFSMDIKALRSKLALTQEELAHKLGVSWGTIARWESGQGKPSKLAQRAVKKLMEEAKIEEI